MTDQSVKTLNLQGIRCSSNGHSGSVGEQEATLVRIVVLSRLLAEALEETEMRSAQLGRELAALRDCAERELDERARTHP